MASRLEPAERPDIHKVYGYCVTCGAPIVSKSATGFHAFICINGHEFFKALATPPKDHESTLAEIVHVNRPQHEPQDANINLLHKVQEAVDHCTAAIPFKRFKNYLKVSKADWGAFEMELKRNLFLVALDAKNERR